MSHAEFSAEWVQRFTDPYALLGVSVAADDRRILKRYRAVAKQLHPDGLSDVSTAHREFATQVLPKLVNPSYQRIKQEKGRSEVLATLRFRVRRLSRDQQLKLVEPQSQTLLTVPEPEVDVFYEHAVAQLSDRQYDSLESFEACTQELSELNLVYLRRKMGDPVIREKRTGLMATASVPLNAETAGDSPSDGKASGRMYADRHFGRAQEYLKTKNTAAAIQELKDALRIDPKNSSYHCLIGQAYLLQKLPGMAKVHLKQALRLNPNNAVALKYAKQLNLDITLTNPPLPTHTQGATKPPTEKRSLFGGLFSRGANR
jgi:curved DNA-binding protein CbpA